MFHLAGLRWDRQWMVVNSKGRACTQRVEPKLALVEVELPSEAFDEAWEPTQDSFMGISYHNFIYLFIYSLFHGLAPVLLFLKGGKRNCIY